MKIVYENPDGSIREPSYSVRPELASFQRSEVLDEPSEDDAMMTVSYSIEDDVFRHDAPRELFEGVFVTQSTWRFSSWRPFDGSNPRMMSLPAGSINGRKKAAPVDTLS